eukprot:m.173691 g.173691  ORF g.173691 m.173691 type:complete len:282 (+) comp18309_c0_seq1:176-1021(+)
MVFGCCSASSDDNCVVQSSGKMINVSRSEEESRLPEDNGLYPVEIESPIVSSSKKIVECTSDVGAANRQGLFSIKEGELFVHGVGLGCGTTRSSESSSEEISDEANDRIPPIFLDEFVTNILEKGTMEAVREIGFHPELYGYADQSMSAQLEVLHQQEASWLELYGELSVLQESHQHLARDMRCVQTTVDVRHAAVHDSMLAKLNEHKNARVALETQVFELQQARERLESELDAHRVQCVRWGCVMAASAAAGRCCGAACDGRRARRGAVVASDRLCAAAP